MLIKAHIYTRYVGLCSLATVGHWQASSSGGGRKIFGTVKGCKTNDNSPFLFSPPISTQQLDTAVVFAGVQDKTVRVVRGGDPVLRQRPLHVIRNNSRQLVGVAYGILLGKQESQELQTQNDNRQTLS